MRKQLLTLLACALLPAGVSAQTKNEQQSPAAQQSAAQKSEALSTQLQEAERLNAEVIKLFRARNFEDAIPLARRVLQIREKELAPGSRKIEEALLNLAELLFARRKYGEAEDYYQRLLTMYELASNADRAATARVLDRLAFTNYVQLDFDKAEKFYLRALALQEQEHGPSHLEVATSLFKLAEFYRLRGDFAKAQPLYRRAIEIRGNALGAENDEVLKTLERYSCLYYTTGQQEKLENIRAQFSFLNQKNAAALDKGEVLNGKAISLPRPAYPWAARRKHLSGTIVVKVIIDESGKVTKAEDICAGHPSLAEAATEAAYKARFSPTLLSGQPVRVSGIITYNFVGQ